MRCDTSRLLLLALVLCGLMPALGEARVGGGESFGGGGGLGGGGGGSGDDIGILIYIVLRLLELAIRKPAIGVPLLIVVLVLAYLHWRPSRRQARRRLERGEQSRRVSVTPLQRMRELDANFSRVLFLDFVGLLYTRAQQARPGRRWEPLRPYLSEKATEQLAGATKGPDAVRDVIVGAIDLRRVTTGGGRVRLTVGLETNLTEVRGEESVHLYSRETWILGRRSGVLSPGPERMRALNCPSCGYPVDCTPEGTCRACNQPVTHGEHGWQVEAISVLERRPPDPVVLTTGGGKELGYDHPTRFAEDLHVQHRALAARHPCFDWEAFEQRARGIFLALQQAWSDMAPERMRPLETDSLFGQHRFWLERYRREGLHNVLEKIDIQTVATARIEQDAFYESITLRIYCRMLDCTVNREGQVVGGSPTEPRLFSEYWTFVRAAGTELGPSQEPTSCPNCGAPLDRVSMVGICEYCESKITTGDFDWVAALIEQDETYRG